MKSYRFTTVTGTALGVSMVVGTGLLSLTGIALEKGGAMGSVLGWVAAAFAIAPFLMIFSSLGRRFENSSGLSECASAAFGEWAGRGLTVLFLSNFLLILPAIALVGGVFLQKTLGFPETATTLVAMGILFFATLLNLVGACNTSFLSKVSVSTLAILLFLLLVSYPHYIVLGVQTLLGKGVSGGSINLADLWNVAALVIFAFLGWENLTFASAEFRDPERSVPRSYLLGWLFVTTLYVSLSLLTVGAHAAGLDVLGPSGLAALLQGLPGGRVLSASVGILSLANATSWMYSLGRSTYLASQKKYLPAFFGELSSNGTPRQAILFTYFLCSIVMLTCYACGCKFSLLFLLVVQFDVIVYLLVVFAFWKVSRGVRAWLVTTWALLACTFLLSGFDWYIVVPLAVFTLAAMGPLGKKMTMRAPRWAAVRGVPGK